MARRTIVSIKPSYFQRGAALILMAFILGLGAAAYLLKTFDAASLKAKQDAKTYQTLKEAKSALIAWAVSHPNVPGMMPWPDRNTDTDFDGDSAYDGKSDCVTTALQYSYLLGQLPWRAQSNPCVTPHAGLGQDFRDAQGNHLWYAVSRNMVHDYEHSEDPIINPGMNNAPHAVTPYQRQGGTQSYPWLRVLDRNGNLISDRVAAVIIAPGSPIGDQDRSSAAPDAREFLDGFKIGAATYKNYDSALVDEDFIMGEDSRAVADSDNTFQKPYYFNDKLVYITIDELMAALERRVGAQVRTSLKAYRTENGYYPYAAKLGSTVMYNGEQNLLSGFLPVNPQICSYTAPATINCTQPMFDAAVSGITQIRFYGSTTFNNSSLGCVVNSSNRCYCTGSGSCSNTTTSFSCSSTGCSAVGMAGSIRVRGGKLTSSSGGCSITTPITKDASECPVSTTNRITCSSVNGSFASHSNGDVLLDSYLPSWFNKSKWGSYVYYQMTRPVSSTIMVGGKVTNAIVVTTGRPIDSAPFAIKGSMQTQPSCSDVKNYLDSAENTNNDYVFDSTSKPRVGNYNDQTFMVAP